MNQGLFCSANIQKKIATGFKTDFEATRQSPGATLKKTSLRKSSERFVVKARGEKGSEACWSTSRTFFADNADPRTSQPIAAGSSFETRCRLGIIANQC